VSLLAILYLCISFGIVTGHNAFWSWQFWVVILPTALLQHHRFAFEVEFFGDSK